MNTWTPDAIDKLIAQVRSRPDIYDQRRAGYSNFNIIDSSWRSIANEFPGFTGKELRKKWQILRTGYRIRRGENSAKASTKWAYFDALSFLEPYLAERPTSSNILGDKEISYEQVDFPNFAFNENGSMLECDNHEDSELSSDFPLSPADNTQLNGRNNERTCTLSGILAGERKTSRKRGTTSPVEEGFLSYLASKIQPKENKSSNELFLSSLLADMDKLPKKELRQFKLQVLQLLNNKLDQLDI